MTSPDRASLPGWRLGALVAAVVVAAVVARVVVSGQAALRDGEAALAAGEELAGTLLLREAVSWTLPLAAPWRAPAAQALWALHERQLAEGRTADAVRTLQSLRSGYFSAMSVLRPDSEALARVDAALAPLMARWEAELAPVEGRTSPGPLGERTRFFAATLAQDFRPSRGWGLLAVAGFGAWVAATAKGLAGDGPIRWRWLAAGLLGFACFLTGVALA